MSNEIADEDPFKGMMIDRINPLVSLFGIKVRVSSTDGRSKHQQSLLVIQFNMVRSPLGFHFNRDSSLVRRSGHLEGIVDRLHGFDGGFQFGECGLSYRLKFRGIGHCRVFCELWRVRGSILPRSITAGCITATSTTTSFPLGKGRDGGRVEAPPRHHRICNTSRSVDSADVSSRYCCGRSWGL